jgi:hypothetical protein
VTLHTFNAFHLGDNLLHLHFLRRLAAAYPQIEFRHTTQPAHHAQLLPLVADLPQITLEADFATLPAGALNAWRGAGGWFYAQPDPWDFLQIHLRWFRHLAAQMGLESPIACARDLLFDYPALQAPPADGGLERVLVVNSPPRSGQWQGFDHSAFDRLIAQLDAAGHNVVTTSPSLLPHIPCTQAQQMDVTAIGRLSQRCPVILGCVTGPMWPTLNIWASPATLRIHLLDTERVELTPNTLHTNSLSLVPEILQDRGLL